MTGGLLDAVLMNQHNDEDTSTRRCPCGELFTWSGVDPRLERWMFDHRQHVSQSIVALRERAAELEAAARSYLAELDADPNAVTAPSEAEQALRALVGALVGNSTGNSRSGQDPEPG